jgi:hypothetical protein
MNHSLVPVVPPLVEETVDPIILEARLKDLRRQYDQTKLGVQMPAGASEEEIYALREAHSARQVSIVKESIAIIAKLRGKASGPAKGGGKRAKKAPIDMSHLLAD